MKESRTKGSLSSKTMPTWSDTCQISQTSSNGSPSTIWMSQVFAGENQMKWKISIYTSSLASLKEKKSFHPQRLNTPAGMPIDCGKKG